MKTAVVTGANGFIGHHLVKDLVDNGYEVWAIVRSENTQNIGYTNVNIIKCDLDNIFSLKNIIGKDVTKGSIFFHLAWEGSDGESRADYELQMKNVIRTVNAAKVAKELGCAKIIVSGSVTQLLYRDYLRRDFATPEMVTCYAVGKMTAEYLLKCVCNEINIPMCWTYITNFYGEDDKTKNFINFLIDKYKKSITPILTPAEQMADFMHVTDVARALRYIAEGNSNNKSYYVGYGNPRPLKEFVEIIHQLIAPDIPSGIGLKEFSGESVNYEMLDYKKLGKETGFIPKIKFEVGIKKVIEARR